MTAWASERHEETIELPWDATRVRDAVIALAREARSAFDETRLWPLHADDFDGEPATTIDAGLYVGASGTLVGLAALERIAGSLELADVARAIYRAARGGALEPEFRQGSYFIGLAAPALVAGTFGRQEAAFDALFQDAEGTLGTPGRELFAGSAGLLHAVRFAHARTGERRWQELAVRLAADLLGGLDSYAPSVRLWTINLYRMVWAPFVGAAHGFAGIAGAVLEARDSIASSLDVRAFENEVMRTISATARRFDGTVNWPPIYGCEALPGPASATRLQWCHGAPGIVTSLHRIPPGLDGAFDELLLQAGETTWRAGPPRGDAGLCHGAAGNGWAFLKLYRRTGDSLWLSRARAFAMHALDTVRRRRERDGSPWYSLFTGDVGSAVYLAACLDLDDRFPALEQ